MANSLERTIAGERMVLYGDRAMFWPARSRLLIADLHLGKSDVFRRAGLALPSGGTAYDLQRLSTLLAHSGARELWVLGDMLHGAPIDTRWREVWNRWHAELDGVRISVIAGNHDRALAAAGLDIDLPGEHVEDAPFLLCHAPQADPVLHTFCGHVHPAIALPGLRGHWPAFWMRDRLTVLPAFSGFTGGMRIVPVGNEQAMVCAHGEIVEVRGDCLRMKRKPTNAGP
ncbi:MAG: ligase-associated DNA damage response endonuclease PdeM [Lysobacter sp.]|nr:ligase-associated DNA damage response endonuclease PdeM [Lysobacter sp.]